MEKFLTVSLESNPRNAKMWMDLASLLSSRGGGSSATATILSRSFTQQDCLEQVAFLTPDNHRAWYDLGVLIQQQKQKGGRGVSNDIRGREYTPQQCFEVCLSLDPSDPEAWYNLGTCVAENAQTVRLLSTSRTYSKLDCFVEAVVRSTGDKKCDAKAWYNIGALLPQGTRTDECLGQRFTQRECFEQSAIRNPMDAAVWFNIALLLDDAPLDGEVDDSQSASSSPKILPLIQQPRQRGTSPEPAVTKVVSWRTNVINGRQFTKQQCLEVALRLDENLIDAWFSLGCLLLSNAENSAKAATAATVAMSPSPPVLAAGKGVMLPDAASLHKAADAVVKSHEIQGMRFTIQECFENYVRSAPKEYLGWYHLGLSLPWSSVDSGNSSETKLSRAHSPTQKKRLQRNSPSKVEENDSKEPSAKVLQTNFIQQRTFTQQECFEMTLRLNPRFIDAWTQLGMTLDPHTKSDAIDSVRYSRQRCFEAALLLNLNDAKLWYNLGASLAADGRTHEIEGKRYKKSKCIERALALDTELCTDAWNALGTSLRSNESFTGEIRGSRYCRQNCFEQSLRLDNRNAEAWYNLAMTLQHPEGFSNTIGDRSFTKSECLQYSVLSQPHGNSHAWFQLGIVMLSLGDDVTGVEVPVTTRRVRPLDHISALEVFENAVEHPCTIEKSFEAEAWNHIGVFVSHSPLPGSCSRQRKSPQECFEESLRCNTKYKEAWYNLGTTLAEGSRSNDILGRTFSEKECFESVLQLAAQSADGGDNRSSVWETAWKMEDAIVWYNLGVSMHPKETALVSGRRMSPQECFETALRLRNSDGDSWRGLGIALLRSSITAVSHDIGGKKYTPRQCLENAVRLLKGRCCDSWYHLAMCIAAPVAPSPPELGVPEPLDDGGLSMARRGLAENEGEQQQVSQTDEMFGRRYSRQECLEECLGIRRDHVDAWYQLALCLPAGGESHTLLGHRFSERDCLQQVLKLSGSFAAAWNLMGKIIERDGGSFSFEAVEVSSSLDCFERAVTLDPANSDAWYNLGMCLPKSLSIRRQDCFERCLNLCPQDEKAWCELGKLIVEDSFSNVVCGKRWTKAQCFEHALSLRFNGAEQRFLFM